jgi:hypothetical protein
MKKTKFLFILLLPMLLAQGVKGQYIPLVDTNKVWSVMSWIINMGGSENSTHTVIYKINGDTIIDTSIYKKLLTTNDTLGISWAVSGYLKEIEKRIFFNNGISERLVYDFNLEVGDTLESEVNPNLLLIVNEIDTITLLNGETRRRLSFYLPSAPFFIEEWIEGIGSINGLLPTYFLYDGAVMIDGGETLLCFNENDTLKYLNELFNTCYISNVFIEDNNKQSDLTLYPNPFSHSLTIETSEIFENVQITIFDMFGRRVFQISLDDLTHQFTLDLPFLPSGNYILKMSTQNELLLKQIISKL